MSMQVLRTKQQVADARAELARRGLRLDPAWKIDWKRRLRRFGVVPSPSVGDVVKSWDVLETVRFAEANLTKSDPILDIGAYASEVLVALHHAGFDKLTGIDLNPELSRMPFGNRIRYVTGDFMATGLPASSFAAITSISVIEHGYDPERLFAEAARLLRPGGCFIASFDYWPDRIDTRGTTYFGMSWTLFSRDDVADMLRIAERNGLRPTGEVLTDAAERAVSYGGFDYTFGWIALRKA